VLPSEAAGVPKPPGPNADLNAVGAEGVGAAMPDPPGPNADVVAAGVEDAEAMPNPPGPNADWAGAAGVELGNPKPPVPKADLGVEEALLPNKACRGGERTPDWLRLGLVFGGGVFGA